MVRLDQTAADTEGQPHKADPVRDFLMDFCGRIAPEKVVYASGLDERVPELLASFSPLSDWLSALPASWELRGLEIQSVDMFGPRVGFCKIKADILNQETGKVLPGIALLRGGAVGVLLVLRRAEDGAEFAVVTAQPRAPIAQAWMREIPAGMLDGDRAFAGVAARELEEECGIVLTADDLVDLTALVYGPGAGMYPSAGGCDEFIRLFYAQRDMPGDELSALAGRLGGVDDETIRLEIHPLDDLPRVCPDAKALSAMTLLSYARSHKLL